MIKIILLFFVTALLAVFVGSILPHSDGVYIFYFLIAATVFAIAKLFDRYKPGTGNRYFKYQAVIAIIFIVYEFSKG